MYGKRGIKALEETVATLNMDQQVSDITDRRLLGEKEEYYAEADLKRLSTLESNWGTEGLDRGLIWKNNDGDMWNDEKRLSAGKNLDKKLINPIGMGVSEWCANLREVSGKNLSEEEEQIFFRDYLNDCKDALAAEENLKGELMLQHATYRDLIENDFHSKEELHALPAAEKTDLLFTDVKILGQKTQALIDSGASKTFVSPRIKELAVKNKLPINNKLNSSVKSRLGTIEAIKESIQLPITLRDREKVIDARVLEKLNFDCIMGLDALREFGVGIDFNKATWCFSSSPFNRFDFEKQFKQLPPIL